ncbi:MAG: hypothetical protein KA717_27150 [Woronichinia naegeliana WA131]|uniref:Uncharacterized protein n=1 Tax=Woronichinia naegeliana WA131 TaxID=2824559 RepID=A0A977KT89_9CYAN|nr:MAG: hypothetical protein KA717_27150 [Woronichinia naegeliana WA131]
MYRKQQYSIETPENLKNLFGGQLDEENRWIEMSKMIPWEEYEEEYAKNFTEKKGAPFCSVPTLTGRGRPRIWGSSIKLEKLFALAADFPTAKVWLYGQQVTVSYQCFEFHWDSPHQLVKFVLTQLPNGRRLILLSTDLCLTGPEIIAAYGLRLKIEVTFRQLVHLLGSFAYRFWLKSLPTLPTWPSNLILSDYPQAVQTQILNKVEAFEPTFRT